MNGAAPQFTQPRWIIAWPYPSEIAGSGPTTAYPRATRMCAFQRQCHEFHEPSGPPWTKTTSGAGASAEAPAGLISHEPIEVPSAAVAVSRSAIPGGTMPPSSIELVSSTGTWSTARGSSRTIRGGDVIVERRANSAVPSGEGHRSEQAPSNASRETRPSSSPPTSTR